MGNRSAAFYVFLLMALLIGVAYYTGLTSDINALGNNLGFLGNVFTGRNQAGNFARYPAGG